MTRRSQLALVIVALLLFGGLLVLVPALLYPPLSSGDLRGVTDPRARIELQQAQSKLANDARTGVLQAIGGLLVALGAVATWRQVRISREGQITDRFTRAVDQLGSDDLNIRVGGIYACERIARNSAEDREHIQFLLCAFVRNSVPWAVGGEQAPVHPTPTVDEQLPWMRVRAFDVQAAMGVIGRRGNGVPQPVLYLSRVDLRSVALRDANLSRSTFRYSNLARSVLIGARLEASDLTGADLRRARLDGARLTRSTLTRAHLDGANLSGADLTGADLSGADLSGADLTGADLSGVELRGVRADAATVWPADVDRERLDARGVLTA
ncbi:pentapeptide repeat-containing protein [Actinoplanes sp. NPDC049265]|uniref:pentapeptide repeat-containing protein n=1 Tax=Actinoplanes sp. NPDC049265 TaxID=3363902 RepID=UPI0037142328